MICRLFLLFVTFFSFFTTVSASEFGQYRYSRYVGLQQQIKAQQTMAQRRRYQNTVSPTKNIKYPTSTNPYPNIQRTTSQQMSAYQRYSPSYYQKTYQNNY